MGELLFEVQGTRSEAGFDLISEALGVLISGLHFNTADSCTAKEQMLEVRKCFVG